MPLRDLVVNIQPKQAGTGDPSPSNVRAISGWTEANITRTGKNILFHNNLSGTNSGVTYATNADGSITLSGTATANRYNLITPSIILPPGTYITSATGTVSSVSFYMFNPSTDSALPATFTLTDYTELRAYLTVYNGAVTNTTIYPMVRLASNTDDTYEPYNSNTYNITFGSAGTVYGGTLDVTTGMLTITKQQLSFNGSENWYIAATGANRIFRLVATSTPIVNAYYNTYIANWAVLTRVISNLENQPFTNWSFRTTGNALNYDILMCTPTTSVNMTLDEYKAMLAATPLVIVADIVTPISVQLDPVSVASLLGNNNIWSDTGSVASCEYRADTKLYLEKLTNPDDDMVANANITSGSYFMVNNSLYLATSAIAAGATIIPGTNCTATNLAAALNAINS